MKIRLVRPAPEMEAQALAYRQAHFDAGETVINGSELLDRAESYAQWCRNTDANTRPETVNPDWVVTDTFFALDEADEIVGIIALRHTLNDFLRDFGHCGYSVAPQKRCRGYATEMLRQICGIARECGMDSLQLSAERSNAPSVKTIQRNGGVYERSFTFEGEAADVYRIALNKA
ncbi:MAG TPA: GNAT family N-acetyltransferase [Ruminococcus sp.]|nr:GNAT family N-acetyltransferase [Ruminococcus sp.]